MPETAKRQIVAQWLEHQAYPVIDCAGKYGAGLALECLGRYLAELRANPAEVCISNKLGWKRIPLTTTEPTFEPGAWFGLQHDAQQCISYEGILACYEQGNELLGHYSAELVSVHDPDEYLAFAADPADADRRYGNVVDAYRALGELRDAGRVTGVGVGSKDWRIIKRLFDQGVFFDWVMLANSFTLLTHPPEVIEFLDQLHRAGIAVINSGVFNAGFLCGGKYFDYQLVTAESHPQLFEWRDRFRSVCETHSVTPALACSQFALSPPGVVALALNTSKSERIADNVALVTETVPSEFWLALKRAGILNTEYPYL